MSSRSGASARCLVFPKLTLLFNVVVDICMKTGFYAKNFGENLQILVAYNRRIHHPNESDKDVHPQNSPKIRMAKVRNEEKLQKQILDQTLFCGKERLVFFQIGKNRPILLFFNNSCLNPAVPSGISI